MSKPVLLVVGDSPTVSTGFGAVIRALLPRWQPHFERIDVWGVNYTGWPHSFPYRIYPAGNNWNYDDKLAQLASRILAGDYTHLFILTDCHMLAAGDLPKGFRNLCDKKGIHLTFYYPVDATLDKDWLELPALADCAITYTGYGLKETLCARPNMKPPHVIGHGVDTAQFYPREDRMSIREEEFKGWVTSQDFLIVNVNRNERRKAPHHSLQILERLRHKHHVYAKMVMHMPNVSPSDYTNLESIGEQLGIPVGEYWKHSDDLFTNGNARLPEDGLNRLYNAADMVLSTSLGEGWGLSTGSEGPAAGCRIACPDHTACGEIARKMECLGQAGQFTLLPLSSQCVVNMLDTSRLRFPVDVEKSAEIIAGIIKDGGSPSRFILNDAVKEWLSWDRIAGEFLRVMGVK
jgi:glycosyltransferase involved in cell wall biosynthesis